MKKKDNQTLEERRLELQRRLDGAKSQEERNRLGQFATPTELAREIVHYSAGLLGNGAKVRFFDPAIGTGAFYSALRDSVSSRRIGKAAGYEIDPHYSKPAKRLWAHTPLELRQGDFVSARAPKKSGEKFNLVVCNPPYVRHHHISNDIKGTLQFVTEAASGIKINGLAGLYCYFLALSHPWMTEKGIGAWLVPSEFMDVNYGLLLKRYLLTKVTLLRIHRFDPNDVQFGDALVSSAVVWFQNEKPPAEHKVEFTFGGTLTKPKLQRWIAGSVLEVEPKWTRFPAAAPRSGEVEATLKDIFKIKRGLATGDNRFFILSAAEVEQHCLPSEFLRPILPSPRYIESDEIQANRDGTPAIDRKLYLLDCRLPEEEVRLQYPALWSYLNQGKPDVSDRYLCRYRRPWYSQEDRPAPPILCTYLGRSDKKSGRPFRFLLNHSQATAANVYLLLYPKPILADALRRDPSLLRRIWEFLNRITPETLLGEGRVYGGGLHKLEPNELANVPIRGLIETFPTNNLVPALQGDLFAASEAR